jgi:hypothetical protein
MYGFSKQTWSRSLLGERWAGDAVLAALTDASLIRAVVTPAAPPPAE